jgi:hypothetical protein
MIGHTVTRKKNNLWLLLALVMVIGLVACNSESSNTTQNTLTSSSPVIDLSSVEISTGQSSESIDLVYEGVAIKVGCFDSNHKAISISNRDAAFDIELYDSDNNLVKRVDYYLILNYLPLGSRDNILWIPFNHFLPMHYGSHPDSSYIYRKFEGNLKIVVRLPDHAPAEAVNPLRLYLNINQPVSQEEYYEYEAIHGPPPPRPSDYAEDINYTLFPGYGVTDVSTLPTFTWGPNSQATSYNFRLATDYQFTNLIHSQTGLPNIYSLTTPLDHGQTYYWELQAIRDSQEGMRMMSFFTTK